MDTPDRDPAETLGDFTATPRLLLISLFAMGIGIVGAFVALGTSSTAPSQVEIPSFIRSSSPDPVVAYPDEPLRRVVYRMAETGLTRFPVIERGTRALVGMIALTGLLKARALTLDAEHRRERVLGTRIAMPFRQRTPV